MKQLSLFFILLYLGFIVGCSAVYDISYDYDRSANFTVLKTYNWLPVPENASMTELDIIRIKKAVNAELEAQDLRLTSHSPDFLIDAYIVTKDKVIARSWGYGNYPYLIYRGYGEGYFYQYEEGMFILDFVNPKSKNLIWRGAAKSDLDYAVTPEKRDKLINEAIHKILQNFPPPPLN